MIDTKRVLCTAILTADVAFASSAMADSKNNSLPARLEDRSLSPARSGLLFAINICCGPYFRGPAVGAAFQRSSQLCSWQCRLLFLCDRAPGERDWRDTSSDPQPTVGRRMPGPR